jgi:hypothetical protein
LNPGSSVLEADAVTNRSSLNIGFGWLEDAVEAEEEDLLKYYDF